MSLRSFFASVYQSMVQWRPTWNWPWGNRRQIATLIPVEQGTSRTTDVEAKVKEDWEQHGVWIDKDCFFGCWDRIWKWIDVGALSGQMMKHGLLCNQDDHFWIDSAKSPRERADNLLHKITPRLGQYGYYLLYMCIRDDEESPHGHGDAVKELGRYAEQHLKQPPWHSNPDHRTSLDINVSEDSVTGQRMSEPNLKAASNGHIKQVMTSKEEVQDPSRDIAATFLEVRERKPIADSAVQALVKQREVTFRDLLMRTYHHLEKVLENLDSFRVCVTLLPTSWKKSNILFAEDDLHAIVHATKLAEIFCILNKYWDFLHYELLEVVVNEYGSDRLKTEMQEYSKEIEAFANTLPLYHFQGCHLCNSRESSIPLEAHIRGNFSSYTLGQARQQQRSLANEYKLQPYTMRLSTTQPGSIILIFLVPSAVVGEMIIKSTSMCDYFSKISIFRLIIGEMCIYCSSRHGNKTQPVDSEVDRLREENEMLAVQCTELEAKFRQIEREQSVEESSYFELDAYQLLREDEQLQMEIGNLLERMNKDDTPYWDLVLEQANTSVQMDSLAGMTPDQKLLAVMDAWRNSAGTVTVVMFCRVCWRAGASLAGDALEEKAKDTKGESSQIVEEEFEKDYHAFIEYFRFSEQENI